MNVSVEKLEGSMAKLTITVEAEKLTAAIKDAYNKSKGKFNIPGFRKGHVPQNMIEKMYGVEVFYEDAANALINDTYADALQECKDLDVVSRPEIDLETIKKGEDFVYTALVAVKPEIKLGEYKGIEIDKIDATVSDEDVDAEIKKDLEKNKRTFDVTDRAAQLTDEVTINFEGFVDGEAFAGGKGDDYKLVLGSHSFIDTFEDQLVGKNIGDKVDVNVTFPEEYHAPELAGKPALFKVEILGIKANELPELDDDFASDVSAFDTVDEYKADVRKKLELKKAADVKNEKEGKILEKIIENSEIELPAPMVEYQQEQMLNEFAQNMAYQGISMEQYMQITGSTKEVMLDSVKPEAERRIKVTLVLEAIAKAEGITATDDELEAELVKMAETYQMELDKIKEIIGEDEKSNIKEDICKTKAAELIIAESKEV